MKITLLGQGFESDSEHSVGNQLINLFTNTSFHSFTGISAFTRLEAINILSHSIKAAKHLTSVTIVTGVNQNVTSKEALEALLELDINSYVFFVSNSSPIFHPKIYLFEGELKSELIIGSSNLTTSGLFLNVETSLQISIDHNIEEEMNVIHQLKDYYQSIFDFSDPNLQKISRILITLLFEANIVSTEAEYIFRQNKEKRKVYSEAEKSLSKLFPSRVFPKLPKSLLHLRKKTKTLSKPNKNSKNNIESIQLSDPIWSKLNLTSSDILIPDKNTTHTTGRLKLTKSIYEIDQTTFFRFNLFKDYIWRTRTNSDKQDLILNFKLVINQVDKGNFNLKITYNPKGDANQKNYNTHISWKGVGHIIRENNLVGKNLFLYKYGKSENHEPDYVIIIG